MKMVRLYQLVATGPGIVSMTMNKLHSKRIFRTREEAEAYMPEFEGRCTTEQDGLDLGAVECVDKMIIAELLLDE
jgi:hypothetical protein